MGRHLAAVAILLCPSFGAAQHPWVDLPFPFEAEDIGLILKAGGPNHDELPRDGVSSCPVVPWVKWRDPVAPSAWQGLLSLVCVDSPGPFAPDRVDVPLAAGRYEGASVWHQWPEPLGEDQTVALRVGTWGRQTDVPLTLRGVELVATREHDEPLYSGTATGRATCAVTVKAWCPTAPHLRPQGVVGAHVTADAVWLRTEEEGQPRWQEHLEEPLRLLRAADGQEFMGARFTLAADAPNMLPAQHYPYPTYLELSLGDASG